MSWSQGLQERETLPAELVEFVERQANARLECLTWYDDDYAVCHFEDGTQLRLEAR